MSRATKTTRQMGVFQQPDMGRKGFTLIELLVTIAIISVFASVILPLSQMSVKRSKETDLRRSLRVIRAAIDEYKGAWDQGRIKKSVGESGYPPDLMTLVKGVDDASLAKSGQVLRFLRRVPRDPMNQDTDLPAEETWGLRSYKSDYDDPREGDDVYDVYSKSGDTGLDGTVYNTW